jgi:cytochrome c-type biogenesis protein CcmE
LKRRHIFAIGIIATFIIFSVVMFRDSLTPYVTFAQAKNTSGNVQVRGVLASEKISLIDNGKMVQFALKDEVGETVTVLYRGTKPDGMEQATSIVAIGKYHNNQFVAEKLLVKCPSKYQGSVKKT